MIAGHLHSYELGVTGGVTSMPDFERRFFPDVYAQQIETAGLFEHSPYCRFNSQRLQLFTSSIFLAGGSRMPAASDRLRRAVPDRLDPPRSPVSADAPLLRNSFL